MAAIGFGLLAAFLWGIGTVVGARLVRVAGAWGALGATMPIGLALIVPFLLFVDRPSASAAAWAFAVGAGIGYVGGMACWMLAVRSGKVSVVSPIVSTDGAMAAIFAVALFGESLAPGVAAALAIVVAGIVVVAIRPETGGQHGQFTGRELTLALASAAFFGFSFVAGGEAQDALGVVWTLFVSRLISTIARPPVPGRARGLPDPARRNPLRDRDGDARPHRLRRLPCRRRVERGDRLGARVPVRGRLGHRRLPRLRRAPHPFADDRRRDHARGHRRARLPPGVAKDTDHVRRSTGVP